MLLLVSNNHDVSNELRAMLLKSGVYSMLTDFGGIAKACSGNGFSAVLIMPDSTAGLTLDNVSGIFQNIPHIFTLGSKAKYPLTHFAQVTHIHLEPVIPPSKYSANILNELTSVDPDAQKNLTIEAGAGRLRLSFSARPEIQIGENFIHLTNAEFNILRYIVLKHPRYVTAEEIYDVSISRNLRSIFTHISNINRKIESLTKSPLLEKYSKKGYRIQLP
jgi:hypothetical protein